MKKVIMSLVVSLLFIMAGCMGKGRYAQFSKDEQSLSWIKKQGESFGDSDYSALKNEKEALDLLQETYQLTVPTYYKKTKKILENELSSETVHLRTPSYAVFARNKELEFQTIYPFYKEEKLQVIAQIDCAYNYSVEQRTAYLKSQIVTIKVAPRKGTLPQNNLSELIQRLGKNMKLPDNVIADGMADYEKKVTEATKPITDNYWPIISNADEFKKNKEFFKEIAVVYDQDGTAREVYAELSDQMQ